MNDYCVDIRNRKGKGKGKEEGKRNEKGRKREEETYWLTVCA